MASTFHLLLILRNMIFLVLPHSHHSVLVFRLLWHGVGGGAEERVNGERLTIEDVNKVQIIRHEATDSLAMNACCNNGEKFTLFQSSTRIINDRGKRAGRKT